jgi:hypothetical protein
MIPTGVHSNYELLLLELLCRSQFHGDTRHLSLHLSRCLEINGRKGCHSSGRSSSKALQVRGSLSSQAGNSIAFQS